MRAAARPVRVTYVTPLVVSVALLTFVALAIIGPMFGTPLGAVDDHEIPVISQQLTEIGYVSTVIARTTEPGGRFRPLYWVGRVAETALWNGRTAGWYFDRLALLLVTLAAGYALARLWLSSGYASLAAALMVAGPQAEAFYMLGPQESYAVPLTLAGLALVGRRQPVGLVLAVAAAFAKEPFVVSAIVAMAWSWHLGQRRAAVMAGAVLAIDVAVIGAVLVTNGGDYYHGAIPLVGRYLYPLILPVTIGLAWLASRHRAATVALVVLVAVGLFGALDAAARAATNARTFAAFVDELRADSRPLVVVVRDSGHTETAWALRAYLPDRAIEYRGVTLTGRGVVVPPCREVDIDGPWTGAC